MKVKKFTAKDMPEAMKKIRDELGEQAVILNSRSVNTGGMFGWFTKKSMEVIAAVDETQQRRLSAGHSSPEQKQEAVYGADARNNQVSQTPAPEAKELQDIKNQIKTLVESSSTNQPEYPQALQLIDQKLKNQEVAAPIRQKLAGYLIRQWYQHEEKEAEQEVFQWAEDYINKEISSVEHGPSTDPKKIINLIGPTGVGKTTTLAKIAAYYHLELKKTVAFITTDTYRIAAVEQLKTYARILDIPLEVAYSIEDFKQAKEKFINVDLILVDSAGRNFLNRLYVEELRKVIDFDDDMETYLVLSLTSKYQDMKKIFEQFSMMPIDRFIFTKKDETSYYGAMINMISEGNTGIAYVTNGQNVPDDMISPAPKTITGWVMKEYADE
ncbi:flagellar biosynthesis protein FlhF [Alteribacillus sp. HJP-4]|uniref:flagellar biosynthesis protein FlhF n=1 Tax=Alteribacillus sp. HJP-4 TaxID=2775394 RepID=UPI0035CD2F9A